MVASSMRVSGSPAEAGASLSVAATPVGAAGVSAQKVNCDAAAGFGS